MESAHIKYHVNKGMLQNMKTTVSSHVSDKLIWYELMIQLKTNTWLVFNFKKETSDLDEL